MPALPIIAAVTAVVGTIGGIVSSQAAAADRQKAAQTQSSIAANAETRQKLDLVRQSRIAQGQVAQSAESQGAGNTSAAAGGQGSIVSQVDSNLSFLDQQQEGAQTVGKELGAANSADSTGALFGGIAQIGTEVFKDTGGVAGLKTSINKVFG